MLDTQTTQLHLLAAEMKLQLQAATTAEESSFREVQTVVNALRTQFPHVSLVGPFLYANDAEVGLEVSLSTQQLEVRVMASRRMLKDNEIGW